jgi:leucyl-tRNA synthetase
LRQDSSEILTLLHATIKKVGEDIEAFKFNTAISSLMILLNSLEKQDFVSLETYKKYILLLSPFAPHMSEELWKDFLQEGDSVTQAPWPSYEESLLVSKTAAYVIQVSGKLRGSIEVSTELGEEAVTTLAKKEPNVAKWLETGEIKKVIFVKNKLINFVV